MSEQEITPIFDSLTYEQKLHLFTRYFSSGYLSDRNLDTKLELIKLICFVTYKMREQNKTISVKEVIEKITHKDLSTPLLGLQTYLLGLSIVCEDFLYEVDTINISGFKDSNAVITRIREILESWFPF